ncbi:hypothetical protein [Streptomyces sp. NPDC059009]|uniref:hypothetical protein n=1 Tax=Streptomyces sp. NPDC059009 TaxID=3346694 RepID=UPI00367E54BE
MSRHASHRRPSASRQSLRTAVLTSAVLGGVLVPSAAAFADDATPKPKAPGTAASETPRPKAPADSKVPSESKPRGGVAAGELPATKPTPAPKTEAPSEAPKPDAPSDAAKKKEAAALAAKKRAAADQQGMEKKPRGGVAAGERPASSGTDTSTVLAGSAAGAALLAGAGTFVLRRRGSGHNG